MAEPQPTPITFENRIAVRLLKLTDHDQTSPVFVEGEGRLVGSLTLPDTLWENMQRSPTLVLEADIERRVEIGLADYVVDLLARMQAIDSGNTGFERFGDRHRQSLFRIRRRLGAERHSEASEMLEAALQAHRDSGDVEGYRPFIQFLLERYYDPMYDYQLSLRRGEVLARGDENQLLDWLSRRGVALT